MNDVSRVPRETSPLDPFEEAIAFAVREAVRRRAKAEAERRGRVTVIEGRKRRGGQAA